MKKLICLIFIGMFAFLHAQGITNTLGGNTASDKFIVENNNGIEILTITGDGNIGINKSNPAFQLDIIGTAQLTGFRLPTGSSNNYVLTSDAIGNGTWQQIPPVSNDNDWTSSGSNLIMVPPGFAGIGTSAPHAKLHVISTTTGGADNTAKFEAAGIGSNASHIHYGTNGDWYIRSAVDVGKVIIQDSGGNVGIGTNNPDAKLAVEGTVKIGINGIQISEISEITGTTPSNGNFAHFDFPSGYAINNTRVLSVEIAGDYGTWGGLGKKNIGTQVGITYNMGPTGVTLTYNSSPYQNKEFRVIIMKVE